LFSLCITALLVIAGCGAPVTPDTSAVQTAAAQTVIAEVTAKAQTPVAPVGSPTRRAQPPGGPGLTPGFSPFANLTPQQTECLRAAWVAQAFQEITTFKRPPSPQEGQAMMQCGVSVPGQPLPGAPTPLPSPKPKGTPGPLLPLKTPVPSVRLSITCKGAIPGGCERLGTEFNKKYPYMVKYLGPPFTIGEQGITVTVDPTVNLGGVDLKTNTVEYPPSILIPPPGGDPYHNLDWSLVHEVGHAFYDIGDKAIGFNFGQWIWEAHSNYGYYYVYWEVKGESQSERWEPLFYDILANLGWEQVNGVPSEGLKYNRLLAGQSAASALVLMGQVLSHDSDFDFLRRVNAELLTLYRVSGNEVITREKYAEILNKVAGTRTVDGMKPGEWLFRQPVSNISGELGAYLLVVPSFRPGIELAVFERQKGNAPRQPEARNEIGLSGVNVAVRVLNPAGLLLHETTVTTGKDGIAILEMSAALRSSTAVPGAYIVEAQATLKDQVVKGTNILVKISDNPDDLLSQVDNRLFIVPMNADGTALRPELVDKLQVTNGKVLTSWPGVLVVTAEPGTGVEFKVGGFQAIVSKPVTARVVPLRIPTSAP
jgi:hypothetical protein